MIWLGPSLRACMSGLPPSVCGAGSWTGATPCAAVQLDASTTIMRAMQIRDRWRMVPPRDRTVHAFCGGDHRVFDWRRLSRRTSLPREAGRDGGGEDLVTLSPLERDG